MSPLRKEITLLFIGLYFGLYVLFTIGIYHWLVVALELRFGSWPWVIFLILGLVSLLLSFQSATAAVSMWWGYNAFLNLWTVKEMFDQPGRRVEKERGNPPQQS